MPSHRPPNLQRQMDVIYTNLPLENIPWNIEAPPDLLVDLVESRRVLPCKAADLGCGAGNYAVWFATRGFAMTGVDISPRAIELAAALARTKGIECRFVVDDLTANATGVHGPFDFAYDWELLHHIFPEARARYVRNVHALLRPGARYLSVCFSEHDPSFGGEGKYRQTPIGTTLYFSSESELEALFAPLFEIDDLRTIQIPGKQAPHQAILANLTRK